MMSVYLRILLVVVSVLISIYIIRKIRKYQLQIEDAIFWMTTAACLLVLSLFPQIAVIVALKLGVDSPVNFVYLVIIFILMVKVFLLSIKISQIEYKFQTIVQQEAIREFDKEAKDRKIEESFHNQ